MQPEVPVDGDVADEVDDVLRETARSEIVAQVERRGAEFLLEQMNQSSPSGMPEIYDGGLLPPVEASPVSDTYDSLLPP